MPLVVTCFCGYFCNNSMQWRPEDYDSYKWVQALKGNSLNKYAYVPVRSISKRLSNENLADAAIWFGTFVSDHLRTKKVTSSFIVVPVPNSDCVSGASIKPRTRKLAKAVCDSHRHGSTVVDCLRWKKNLGSASKNCGPREAAILYGNLTIPRDLAADVDHKNKVLLVDDVTTSGGHLQACAAMLESKGLNVELIMCGGKTVYDQVNGAFHVYEYTVDEYVP